MRTPHNPKRGELLGMEGWFFGGVITPLPPCPLAGCLEQVKRQLFRVGEDWYFLFILGVLMATISFTMDLLVSRIYKGKRGAPTGGLPPLFGGSPRIGGGGLCVCVWHLPSWCFFSSPPLALPRGR